MLYRLLLEYKAVPPTILNSSAKNPLKKAFVQLAPFLHQTNTITVFKGEKLSEEQIILIRYTSV